MKRMSNSPLATTTQISPNKNSPRNHKIDRITIHCFVGQVTARRGCEVFQPSSKKASCNYVVGYDGSIGLCVDEGDCSWCSSSSSNDNRAVTIETASESTAPYKVTDRAYSALLDLVTDICRRNGAKKLLWFGDKDKTLAYGPKDGEMVMTVHRWFANKSCPGDYLYERHGEIAAEVTRRLEGDDDEMSYEQFKQYMSQYRKELQDNDSGSWSKENRQWAIANGLMAGNGTTVEGEPNMMWEDFLTREQNATVSKRLYDLIMAEVKKLLDDRDKAIKEDIGEIVAEAVAEALKKATQQ